MTAKQECDYLADAIENAHSGGHFGSTVEYLGCGPNHLDFQINDKNCRLNFVMENEGKMPPFSSKNTFRGLGVLGCLVSVLSLVGGSTIIYLAIWLIRICLR